MTAYIKLKTENQELHESHGQELIESVKNLRIIILWNRWIDALTILVKNLFCIITIKPIYQAVILVFPFQRQKKQSNFYKKIYYFQMKHCVKHIKRIIKINHIDEIVLSEELKNDSIFMKYFLQRQPEDERIAILNGKELFPYLTLDIIQTIFKKLQTKTEQEDIYFLANENNQMIVNNILLFLHQFRTVNIVTKQVKVFQKMANKIEEKEGIPITVSNNKKKSLKKANYIINFDFTQEELKLYAIHRNAIILQMKEENYYKNRFFDGIEIQNIEIDISQKIKELLIKNNLLRQTSLLKLYEGLTNKKESFEKMRKKFRQDEIKIIHFYGKNGIIDDSEYKRIKMEIKDTKSSHEFT